MAANLVIVLAIIWSFGGYQCQNIAVNFLKTKIVEETAAVQQSTLFTYHVRSELECIKCCATNFQCRKVFYSQSATADKSRSCSGYTVGENCVVLKDSIEHNKKSCYRKLQQIDGTKCVSPLGYYGDNCENVIKDCQDGKDRGFTGQQLAFVKPADETFEVPCNFDTGVTTIQLRRRDSVEVNFTRPWLDYINGFGNRYAEFWLGLNNIVDLTNLEGRPYRLEVLFRIDGQQDCFYCFNNFFIDDNNLFTFQGTNFNCPNTCSSQAVIKSGSSFSTYDRHNFGSISTSCFIQPKYGGWWYTDNACSMAHFNYPRALSKAGSKDVLKIEMTLKPLF